MKLRHSVFLGFFVWLFFWFLFVVGFFSFFFLSRPNRKLIVLSGQQLGPEELRWRAFAQCVLLNSFGSVGSSTFTFNYEFFLSFGCPFWFCSCPPLYCYLVWCIQHGGSSGCTVCPLSSSCSYLNAWLCPCSSTLWLAGLLAWPPPLASFMPFYLLVSVPSQMHATSGLLLPPRVCI